MIPWTTARRATAGTAGCVLALALTAAPSAASADGVALAEGTARSGAVLSLAGAPLVHTFDTTTPGDSIQGEWTLSNNGTQAVTYDGVLAPVGEFSLDLAQNLDVAYGVVGSDGQITGWARAGTLAQPVSYTTALGADSPEMTGTDSITIPVRVTLTDPEALTSPYDEEQTVGATFSINYLSAPSPGPEGPAGPGDGGSGDGSATAPGGEDVASGDDDGLLASTGAQILGWLLLALAAVTVGSRLRRRRRTD